MNHPGPFELLASVALIESVGHRFPCGPSQQAVGASDQG
jgi:hypothetical protein